MSEFWALMEQEFGQGYAALVAQDQALGSLGSRTVEQALDLIAAKAGKSPAKKKAAPKAKAATAAKKPAAKKTTAKKPAAKTAAKAKASAPRSVALK